MTFTERWQAFLRSSFRGWENPANKEAVAMVAHAYHQGGYDMLVTINRMPKASPAQMIEALKQLELECRAVIDSPGGPVQ